MLTFFGCFAVKENHSYMKELFHFKRATAIVYIYTVYTCFLQSPNHSHHAALLEVATVCPTKIHLKKDFFKNTISKAKNHLFKNAHHIRFFRGNNMRSCIKLMNCSKFWPEFCSGKKLYKHCFDRRFWQFCDRVIGLQPLIWEMVG